MHLRNKILFALLISTAVPASAVDLGSLKGAVGNTDAGSLLSSNAGNVAGIVQFCIKNKYLNNDVAGNIKDRLLGKYSLGTAGNDSSADKEDENGYADGLAGMLSTKEGKRLDLSDRSDKLKEKFTRKACDVVLDQGQSLLGG